MNNSNNPAYINVDLEALKIKEQSCEHKYVYLGQRRIKDGKMAYKTNLVDVFYCEKCLDYQYKKLI